MRRQDKNTYIVSPRAGQQETPKPRDERNLGLITVVLLSENHGHRMKSYGPISLLKIGGKSLVEKQIESVNTILPNSEIVLCCGYEAFKTVAFVKSKFATRNPKVRVVENQLHYNTNCCESARLCLSNTMNDKILFISGGVLLKPEHLAVIDFKKTSIVTQDSNNNSNLEVGVIENDSILENMSFGIKTKYWSEIFYLTGVSQINEFYSLISGADYKNKFLFEAINEFARKFPVSVAKATNSTLIKIDNIKTIKGMTK
jgi:choline kinase